MLKKFSVNNLILIALLAALGVASKVLIGSLIRMITSSIGIPGGAIAGGFYMLWLPLAIGLTKKRGSATLLGTVQALMVFVPGLPGSHGAMSIITYVLPGLACDCVFLLREKNHNILHFLIGAAVANIIGTLGTNMLFFRLPINILILTLTGASLSGAIGGIIAYYVLKKVHQSGAMGKAKNEIASSENNFDQISNIKQYNIKEKDSTKDIDRHMDDECGMKNR